MSQNQGNAQPQPNAAARGPQLYKPEHMRQLPLSDEEKHKYEAGLRQLWSVLATKAEGTPEWQSARSKIVDFSNMLTNKLKQMPNAANQGNRPTTGPQQGQAPATSTSAAIAGASLQPQQQAGRPVVPWADQIKEHLRTMTFHAPQEVVDAGPEHVAKYQQDMRGRYGKALQQMYQTADQIKKFDAVVKGRNEKGQPLNPEELKNYQDKKQTLIKAHGEAKAYVEKQRRNQDQLKTAHGNSNPGQPRPQSNGGVSNANVNQPGRSGPSPQQSNQGIGQNNGANAGTEATKNQQPGPVGKGMPGANGQVVQQQSQPVFQEIQAPQTTSAAPQHSPIAASPAPPPQNIKIEPGTQPHPHPPPVNTAIASASAVALPSAGTPTQNSARGGLTPQSATSGTGPVRPLSHQAALTLANQRGSQPGSAGPGQQQQQQQQQQHPQQPQPNQSQQATPQGPGGTPSGVPGVMGTVQPQGHTHAHPSQQIQPLTQKLPISKVLPEKATMPPQAVNIGGGVGAGRPTYTAGSGIAGGSMGQPVIAKPPPIQLEGEGERVLNRKKLDELVRQVCGGQAEGLEGNHLSPDVEEAVLNVADSFVDNVLNAACKNAKERGSKVLEIRDIQLVLERTYNMRIPGYSSDELRTVRKIQPASGWITKMSAIQAAKVMPGKGDL